MRRVFVGFLFIIGIVTGGLFYVHISPSYSSSQWFVKLYHPFFINPSRYDLQIKNLGEENAITIVELYQVGPGGTKSLINAPTVIYPGLEKGEHAGISFLLYNRVPKIEVVIV